MIPKRIEYEIEGTIHGQPVRLVYELQNGRRSWTLHRDAANQRDDSVFISGLSDHAILSMAEAVKSQRMSQC